MGKLLELRKARKITRLRLMFCALFLTLLNHKVIVYYLVHYMALILFSTLCDLKLLNTLYDLILLNTLYDLILLNTTLVDIKVQDLFLG